MKRKTKMKMRKTNKGSEENMSEEVSVEPVIIAAN